MTEQTSSSSTQTLTAAIHFLQGQSSSAPPASDLVTALLAIEKQVKRDRKSVDYENLLGTWRLGFTTGTVKTRQRTGTVLGAGRFLPKFLTIQLKYVSTDLETARGTAENSVALGPMKLQLTGPTQFWPITNSLSFDFTQMRLTLAGLTLYQGSIRGGATREAQFYQETLKTQAFFTYFWVTPTALAARGKGGGLALWTAND